MTGWALALIPYFKAVHITALIVWCAGLLALPLMLSRQNSGNTREDYVRIRRATHLTYTIGLTPAAVIAVVAGTWLIFLREALVPWLYAKLVFVALLVIAHAWIGRIVVTVAEKRPREGQPSPLPREHRQRHARRRILRKGGSHHQRKKEDQGEDHEAAPIAQSAVRSVTLNRMSPTLLMAIALRGPNHLTTHKSSGNGLPPKEGNPLFPIGDFEAVREKFVAMVPETPFFVGRTCAMRIRVVTGCCRLSSGEH